MSLASYVEQYIEQGSTFVSQITLTDNSGTPFDLTGFTIRSEAKRNYASSNVAIEFETAYIDQVNGVIQLVASAPVTSNLVPGKLVYDVLLKEIASGVVTRIVEGQILISPGATSSSNL